MSKAGSGVASLFAGRDRLVWVICALAIVVGSIFRFVNLDRKVMVCDETLTALQVGGYSAEEKLPRLYDHLISVDTVLAYPSVCPDSTVFDTFESCRLDTPFNPPLYFVLAGCWARFFGTGAIALRSFSALISLLEVPCFYFLCMELFESAPTAAIVLALAMVSPGNLLNAQFARPYSLWAVLTLLSSILLLRASRTGARRTWIAFTGAAAGNLYSHLSALRVLLGQVIFACTMKISQRQYKLAPVLYCCGIALMLFVPWLIELNNHLYGPWRGAQWFSEVKTPTQELWQSWCNQLSQVFVQLDYLFPREQQGVAALMLCFEAVAVSVFVRTAPKISRMFLLSLVGTTFLTLAVTDLVLGGGRSTESRYMLPVALSLQCVIGFFVASLSFSQQKCARQAGVAIFMAVTTIGLLSCWSVLQDRTWQGWGTDEIAVANHLNKCEKPVLFGWQKHGGWRHQLLSLCLRLRPDAQLKFCRFDAALPLILPGMKDVFIWDPSPQQLKQLSAVGQNYVQVKEGGGYLWKLDLSNWTDLAH